MKTSIWFWITCSIITLCYLLFNITFLLETFGSPEFITKTFGDKNAKDILGRPWWAKTGYSLSLVTGLVCCIMLLFKNPNAYWFAIISLIGMIIQQYYWYAGLHILDKLKGVDWIWPVIIPAISLSLYFMAIYIRRVVNI